MGRADVVIGGGGTGGHIYPGLAVAEALRARHPGVAIAWVGTARGLEAQIVPRAGWPFYPVPARGLQRKLSLQALGAVWTAGRGFWVAWRLLGKLRPRVVLGTGGYAAAPVVFGAILRRIPVVLQEQNARPGLVNRLASRFAWRLALGSPAAARYFGPSSKVVVTGNPTREGIASLPPAEGFRRLGLDPSRRLVFFMGASQGARSMNDAFVAHSGLLRARDGLQFLLSTGPAQFDGVATRLREQWGPPDGAGPQRCRWGNLHVWAYVDDMPAAYAAAQLVVARAGAMSLAEITARGVPAVLVPYPYSAEGHQEENARELAAQGAAVVVADKDCREELIPTVLGLAGDQGRLEKMRAASKAWGRPGAAQAVAGLLEVWLGGR